MWKKAAMVSRARVSPGDAGLAAPRFSNEEMPRSPNARPVTPPRRRARRPQPRERTSSVSLFEMNRRTLVVLFVACLSLGSFAAGQEPASRPVAILGVPAEVKDIESQLLRATTERVQGVPFSVGVIGSTRVILGKTNAGKVNAAMMTALVIAHYAPSRCFSGTAGAIDLAQPPTW